MNFKDSLALLWIKNILIKMLGFLGIKFKSKIDSKNSFGINFKQFYHKGDQAIKYLLKQRQGQVQGAFYRKDLEELSGVGDIDLVWGETGINGFGLAHILEQRTKTMGRTKALKFIEDLPRIIEEAKIYKVFNDKIELVTEKEILVLGKRDNGSFVLTAFKDRRSKKRFKELGNTQMLDDADFTSKSMSEQSKTDNILLQNQLESKKTKILPSSKRATESRDSKGNPISLDDTNATAVPNYSTNKSQNQGNAFFPKIKQKIQELNENLKKEQRRIYNVTLMRKKATPIKTDLEAVEDSIIEYIAMYVKGFHLNRRDKGKGSKHIKLHLEKGSEGEISLEKLLNLGNSLREYLKIFKKPFIEDEGAKIYEWENGKGVRFRAVIDNLKDGQGHTSTTFHPSNERIISFYSDRNLRERMEFKNPKVKEYYENQNENLENSNKKINTTKRRQQ